MKAKNTEVQKIYVRYRVADNTFWTTGSLLPVMAIKPRLRLIRGVMYSSLPFHTTLFLWQIVSICDEFHDE